MSSAAPSVADAAAADTGILARLRRELAPSTHRWRATVRIVLTIVLVVVISMALDVPLAGLSAYMVIFVTMRNPRATLLATMLLSVGMLITTAATLALATVTLDDKPLRYAGMAAVLFTGLWLARATKLGPLAYVLGFLICVTQSVVDESLEPELYVRGMLWLWVVITYPVVLTALVNQFVLPDDTAGEVRAKLDSWRRVITDSIEGLVRGTPGRSEIPPELSKIATAEVGGLEFLGVDAALQGELKRMSRLAREVAAMSVALDGPAPDDTRRALGDIRNRIEGGATEPPVAIAVPGDPSPADVALRDLTSAAEACAPGAEEKPASAAPARKKKRALFVPDAWTNPVYSRFAFKGTLAAMICYTTYMALDWIGIHTALITCIIVVLGSTGATLHKSALRITGCCIGALFTFFAILYVIPELESITGLAILVAVVSFIGAWVGTGSEWTSYAGLQFALVFFLSVLESSSPATDFDPVRDRTVGILLGVVVTGTIFATLWPERASQAHRASIGSVLRLLAALIRGEDDAEPTWSEIQAKLAVARKNVALELFEPWKAGELEEARRGLRRVNAVADTALEAWAMSRWRSASDIARYDAARLAAAEAMERAAQRIEGDTAAPPSLRASEAAETGRDEGPAAAYERLAAEIDQLD